MTQSSTLMAADIREIPICAQRLLHNEAQITAVARALAQHNFTYAIICGRGSSGHAGVHLRYLIETQLSLGVSNSAPSVITGYHGAPRMAGALFIVISQSGRSPDLVAATKAARDGGAVTVAIVNDAHSPAAQIAEYVIDICAGQEIAVAATKTVVNSMLAGAILIAEVAGQQDLLDALQKTPQRFKQALSLDWQQWAATLKNASAAYVTGRGYGYGPVREIALKMSETLNLPALAYSAAELLHGPRGALSATTPVLALRQNDPMAQSVDALVRTLEQDGLPVAMCGGSGKLSWIGDENAVLDPVVMLLPAYLAIEQEARRRGRNPDQPAGLQKVTETL